MRNEFSNKLIAVFTFCLIGLSAANAQGNNFGLSNSTSQDMISLSNRLFNLEERNKAFQVKLNLQGDIDEILDSDENSGGFHINTFRPEFVGSLGKWGYRLRFNLCKSFSVASEGVNTVVDIGKIFYESDKWTFSFGKSLLNYGTYEFEWNPVNVLHYYEFQSNIPNVAAASATVGYKTPNHLLTLELANADRLPVLADFSAGQTLYAPVNRQMQYNLSWRGNMLETAYRQSGHTRCVMKPRTA